MSEHLDRIRAMIEPDQQTWDLNQKDTIALSWLLHEYDRQRSALLVASTETDVLGDVDLHELASEIAEARDTEEAGDQDYIEAYLRAVERLT